jgi:hypothetical protein
LTSIESLDLDTLMALAERIATRDTDGHLTLLRFTTGWKCMLGTPNLDGQGRKEVNTLPTFGSIREALVSLLSGSQGQ